MKALDVEGLELEVGMQLAVAPLEEVDYLTREAYTSKVSNVFGTPFPKSGETLTIKELDLGGHEQNVFLSNGVWHVSGTDLSRIGE